MKKADNVWCQIANKEREMIKKFILIIFIIISINLAENGFCDGAGPYESIWGPDFYDQSMQEGRNNCLGIIIFESNPRGPEMDDKYSIYFSINLIMNEDQFVIKDTLFDRSDAIAESTKTIQGEDYPVYLFMVTHICLPDVDTDYGYILVESDLPWDPNNHIDSIHVYYYKTNIECNQNPDPICSNIDLEPFYEWAAESIDDDDTPYEDDDETPAEDDDDDNDDGQCGGCAFTGDDVSFSLAFMMVLIGAFAWMVSRRKP